MSGAPGALAPPQQGVEPNAAVPHGLPVRLAVTLAVGHGGGCRAGVDARAGQFNRIMEA